MQHDQDGRSVNAPLRHHKQQQEHDDQQQLQQRGEKEKGERGYERVSTDTIPPSVPSRNVHHLHRNISIMSFFC